MARVRFLDQVPVGAFAVEGEGNAVTASYALVALSASYASSSTSASYALTASYAMNGGGGGGTPGGSNYQIQYNNSGSFGGVPTLTYSASVVYASNIQATGSFSGSLTGTSSFTTSASYASSSTSASYALNSTSASYASSSTSASYASSSTSASYASSSTSASYASSSTSASYASSSTSASYASSSTSASYASSSTSASYALDSKPAGNNGEIQYNNSGTLGANTNLNFDDASNVLSVGKLHTLPLSDIFGGFTQGEGNEIRGKYTTALGHTTKAIGDASISAGTGSEALGNNSLAVGEFTIASGSNQTVVGAYNTQGDASALFIIGNGTDDLNRNDLAVFDSNRIKFSASLQMAPGEGVTADTFTGDLTGTASSASFITSSNVYGLYGSDSILSASYASSSTSASYASSSTSASYALSASQTLTASYINNLNQNLNITGNLNITSNLNVIGTASFVYTTQSVVIVGNNTILLNTDNPAVRFGGIEVVDSGSFGNSSTGSLLWDSQNNKWIYSNPSGSSYDGGMLISGPRNTSGLGNEVGLTQYFVAVSQGEDHITSSQIYSSGSITQITGSLYVTNGVTGSFTGSLIGDLTGTASFAASASYASSSTSASYASSSTSASYASSSTSASYASSSTSASYASSSTSASYASSSTSASYASSSTSVSYASSSTSASYAFNSTTASYALTSAGGGGGGTAYQVGPTSVGDTEIVSYTTGSNRSAFSNYVIYSGSNSRAGQFITVWNGTTAQYTDVSTLDIGNTSTIVFTSSISTNLLKITANTPISWSISMSVTFV